MKFSERIGVTPIKSSLQIEGMDDKLRNSLWNVLDTHIWSARGFMYGDRGGSGYITKFSQDLWFHYFKKPIDSCPDQEHQILKVIRKYYFDCEWYEVYDLLEYILSSTKNRHILDAINSILERELSGYRFIKSAFVPVTDKTEIEGLNEALSQGPYNGVQAHLKQALEHLSRRANPDYRNSIKESISAVESIAKEATGNPKATLGDALSLLEKHGKLHPALKKGFSSIYGYTSDEGGIRHAMSDEPNITVADAKFFLISCSAFVNYLKSVIG